MKRQKRWGWRSVLFVMLVLFLCAGAYWCFCASTPPPSDQVSNQPEPVSLPSAPPVVATPVSRSLPVALDEPSLANRELQEKQIYDLLQTIKALLESREWDKYMDLYVDNYEFAGGSRESYRKILENMAAVGFKCNLDAVEIGIGKSEATASNVALEFERADAMVVRLTFKRIEGAWRISGADKDESAVDELPDVIDYSEPNNAVSVDQF
ncbi:MAG TPA: hypothetical protein PKO36_06990 [Candidatus Hydrogenedentes bacterium]|nr:hypothetical protein [Candidatus Hydrogenedentota bacterium]